MQIFEMDLSKEAISWSTNAFVKTNTQFSFLKFIVFGKHLVPKLKQPMHLWFDTFIILLKCLLFSSYPFVQN